MPKPPEFERATEAGFKEDKAWRENYASRLTAYLKMLVETGAISPADATQTRDIVLSDLFAVRKPALPLRPFGRYLKSTNVYFKNSLEELQTAGMLPLLSDLKMGEPLFKFEQSLTKEYTGKYKQAVAASRYMPRLQAYLNEVKEQGGMSQEQVEDRIKEAQYLFSIGIGEKDMPDYAGVEDFEKNYLPQMLQYKYGKDYAKFVRDAGKGDIESKTFPVLNTRGLPPEEAEAKRREWEKAKEDFETRKLARATERFGIEGFQKRLGETREQEKARVESTTAIQQQGVELRRLGEISHLEQLAQRFETERNRQLSQLRGAGNELAAWFAAREINPYNRELLTKGGGFASKAAEAIQLASVSADPELAAEIEEELLRIGVNTDPEGWAMLIAGGMAKQGMKTPDWLSRLAPVGERITSRPTLPQLSGQQIAGLLPSQAQWLAGNTANWMDVLGRAEQMLPQPVRGTDWRAALQRR